MQGQWQGQWGGDWLGGVAGGNPVVLAALVVGGVGSAQFTAQLLATAPQAHSYAIEKPQHDGESLMAQVMEEDEMILAMLHVLVEEL